MMLRSLVLVFVLAAAFAVQGQQQKVRVESVEPDRTVLYLPCAPGRKGEEKCNDSLEVRVRVKLSGADAASAKLVSVVTGGRVVTAENGEISWDLTGVHPGTYTITVSAEDRDGRLGEGKTAPITVEQCPSCGGGDVCHTAKLMVPESLIQPGQSFNVTADISGPPEGVTYNWTLSNGTIASGQGTPSISIDTTGVPGGSSISVTLDLGIPSGFPECQRSFTETVQLVKLPEAELFDEFSTVAVQCEEGNARLDSFFAALSNNPSDQGVIVIYGSPKSSRAAWRREQLIRNFIRIRRFDPMRITFVRGASRDDAVTQFWRVPPGAPVPEVPPADAETPQPAGPPKKPYLYATEYSDGLGECSVPMYDLETYAAVLNIEPRSRGRIVIGQPSKAAFAEKQREIAAELAKHGVAKVRITFIYKYVRPNRALETTELWVVPSITAKKQ